MELATVDMVMAGLFLLGGGLFVVNMAMPADKKILAPGGAPETAALAGALGAGGWLAVRTIL